MLCNKNTTHMYNQRVLSKGRLQLKQERRAFQSARISGKVPESQLYIFFVPVPYILRKCQGKHNFFKGKMHRRQNVTGNLGHP